MRASDKEALIHECLVQNYEKYYRMAYSYVFREQDAMDIVQEAAYRAILKSDLLKQPEYADTWICRIVIHEALRFLKKNKQTASVEEVLEHEKERSIVVLRYFEEEKIETIGQIMNLNVSTVKSKLYRAMDKLKKYMEAGGVNYGRLEKGV